MDGQAEWTEGSRLRTNLVHQHVNYYQATTLFSTVMQIVRIFINTATAPGNQANTNAYIVQPCKN